MTIERGACLWKKPSHAVCLHCKSRCHNFPINDVLFVIDRLLACVVKFDIYLVVMLLLSDTF